MRKSPKVRMQRPRIATLDTSIAKAPAKVTEPFYGTAEWKRLRLAVLTRDGFRCAAPGCVERAVVVDHIVSPKNGGGNEMANLRSCCRLHDNRVKEDALGTRRSGGHF